MHTRIRVVLLVVWVAALLAGCVPRSEAERLQAELHAANASLATLQAEREKLQGELDALQTEHDVLLADYDSAQTELKETRQTADELQEEADSCEKTTAALKEKIKKASNLANVLNVFMQATETEEDATDAE